MCKTKGIILAGGNGSRLFPLTKGMSKQLLPVYDKPMIYYPLATLMIAGIKDILIISKSQDIPRFKKLFSDGSKIGLKISYEIQNLPNGIAEAFIIGSEFIGTSNVCLVLGDNIFYSKKFELKLREAKNNFSLGASTIFSVHSNNPEQFGVIEFNNNKMIDIIEKPEKPKSNYIVSGLYFYTNDVVKIAKTLKPSNRGELEISEINQHFLNKQKLKLIKLDSEFFWSDTGTYDSLIKASKFFYNYENKYRKKIACIEEIALRLGYINEKQFVSLYSSMKNSNYGKYLLKIINKNI